MENNNNSNLRSIVGSMVNEGKNSSNSTNFQFFPFITQSSLGLGLLTAIFIMLLNMAFQPIFLCNQNQDPLKVNKFVYWKSALVATTCGAFVILLPVLNRLRLFQTHS